MADKNNPHSNALVERTFDYDQIPAGYYDRVAAVGKGVRSFWHRYKFDYVIYLISQTFKNKSSIKIVDLGCGPGTFLGRLASDSKIGSAISGLGVDIATPQVEYAQNTYGSNKLSFKSADIEDPIVLKAISEAQAVSLIEVIEHMHLKDVKKLLHLLYENMKPGTQLFITTPNYLSYWPLLELIVNYVSEVNYEEQHVTKLNRRKLMRLIGDQGFKVKHVRSFMHFSPFAAGLFGPGFSKGIKFLEDRFFTHGGPLLCAQVER